MCNKKYKKEYTVIIGCGMLGSKIAESLSNEGEDVLIMDIDENSLKKLSSNFGGLSKVGNGLDLDTLKEAKMSNAKTALVVTNNDNTNIMIAQMAKDVFKVERVVARLYDPERELVYKGLGIITICPAELSVRQIENVLNGFNQQEIEDEIQK